MSGWAGRFGAAWAALDAAHDLADHVIQTDHQAARKADDWRAMLGHVSSYTAFQVAALAALAACSGRRPSAVRLVAAVALSAGTHAFLDRRWPVLAALERTGSASFAASRVRAEHALRVLPNADGDPDGPSNLEEAGHAMRLLDDARRVGDYRGAGELLSYAVAHAVEVVDPERPFQLHGPYLADQSLHRAALLVCAAILAGPRDG